MNLIASAFMTAPVSIQDFLLASLVPCKPKHFCKFRVNSLNLRGNNDIVDSMWKYLYQLLRDEEQEAKKKKEEEQKLQRKAEEATEKSLDEQDQLSVSANGKEPDKKKTNMV